MIPGLRKSGEITLNGPAARKVAKGDVVIGRRASVVWVICPVRPERLSVRTFFGATTRQRPSYLIKTPHHHHHNTTEEEDRADNTPSPPPLAALFVGGGGGGGRRREEKKKRKNILYARNAFFCMMYSISVSEPNIPI